MELVTIHTNIDEMVRITEVVSFILPTFHPPSRNSSTPSPLINHRPVHCDGYFKKIATVSEVLTPRLISLKDLLSREQN